MTRRDSPIDLLPMNLLPMNLLIATGNAGKVIEIRAALRNLPINLRSLNDFSDIKTVDESGSTYEENAVLKARGYSQQTGLWSLADDSGLEVEALDGAPGVLSARYAGQGASDGDRIDLLLQQLERTQANTSRNARFVCAAALADPTSTLVGVVHGVCEGRIIDAPRGENGFGYDPIFVPEGFDQTFAELPDYQKDAISHRGKALEAMRTLLAGLVAGG